MADALPWFLAITFGLGFAAGLLRGRLSWSNLAIAVAMAEGALVAFSAAVLVSVVVAGWDGSRSREMTGFLLFVPFVCFGLATYGLVPIAVGAVAGLAVSPRMGNRVVKERRQVSSDDT